MDITRYYGVWIPREGWLKVRGDVYADQDLELLKQVCKFIGMSAEIRILDKSCPAELEVLYLQQENKKWHFFKNFFGRKASK